MELIKPAQHLDTITKEIHQCILEGTRRFLMIGKLLKQVQDDNMWQLTDANSFLEWAEREIKWKRAQVYNAMGVFDRFGAEIAANPALLEIEPTRLIRLLPMDDGRAHLHEAATLTATDFDNHLKMATGKQPTDSCNHEWEAWKRCKLCQKFHREAEICR